VNEVMNLRVLAPRSCFFRPWIHRFTLVIALPNASRLNPLISVIL
jgi:hypothetical protein